jgi:hypothetical protein
VTSARIGILARGDPRADTRVTTEGKRVAAVFAALDSLGAVTVPIVYADDAVEEVRAELLGLDGVLVWVDPITNGEDRSQLDPMLRDVAARGVWVSTRPDVIIKMGTKEVLYRTRALGWGTDIELYSDGAEFRARFPAKLAAAGPRVLKQNRGNGGNGVWRVEVANAATPQTQVRVLHAFRGSVEEELPLGDFMARCEAYFAGGGRIIDQPFQARLAEGMIRCYLVEDVVVGFGQQLIRALMPTPPGVAAADLPLPGPRIMYGAAASAFQALREKMEHEWVPAMMRLLGIDKASLPALWDADFLYGPKDESGADTFVLCEINVSCVSPFPDEAVAPLARTALSHALAAHALRG